MNILFITATRLGDAVLSTGALDHLLHKHPNAEVTVICGTLVSSLFEGFPQVVRILPPQKEKYGVHWLRLWRETRSTEWDIIVDLRNSILSRTLKAQERYIWRKPDDRKHKVEQIGAVMGLSPLPSPTLLFNQKILFEAEKIIPDGKPVLAIAPTANWQGKTWPVENFIALIKKITDGQSGFLPNASVAIFAAPGEEKIAYQVLNALPKDRQVDVIAKTSPALAAAAIARCAFYVGNDSGLTHCAAAVKTPTLGLFGPSWPHLYRPWGDHCAYVSTPETYAELTSYKGYTPETAPCLMESLTVDMAFTASQKLWQKISG